VETHEQLKLLTDLGCDQYQGFYFSPALVPARFAALVKQASEREADEEAAQTHSKLAGLRP
jgi:EAL domain-containing protein (putative c-di-GMP-specific phosphodiesterase class I)